MADIIVDTYKLNQYAQRIATVNSRINRLDRRLDSFYTRVGLQDLFNLIQIDILTSYSCRLMLCQSYLQQTALDFECIERELLEINPTHFTEKQTIKILPLMLQDQKIKNFDLGIDETARDVLPNWFIESFKAELSNIPENIKSAGEVLAWLEKNLPKDITHALDVFIPGSLKRAYDITSGILQGSLSLKDFWGAVKEIVKKNIKILAICETIEYVYGDLVSQRNAEMNEQLLKQLTEGDIIGLIFDGAEGFIDTIIGGSIDVLGITLGKHIDLYIDKEYKALSPINDTTEYITGMLGANDGDGYSLGGLITKGSEMLSEGIDDVTDAITDSVNIVTDTIIDKTKTTIDSARSWFD